jgi:hypothetical protein
VCDNTGMRTRALLTPVLTSALLLAACGTDDADTSRTSEAAATASASASSSPVPGLSPAPSSTGAPAADEAPAGEEPEFRADAGPDTSPGEGNGLSVVDVRVGEHEGYDRVVFELGGTGTAGWRVQYEDDPRTQGEGAPVELDGDATLTVAVEGVGYPFDTGVEEYSGPRRFSPALSSVREVQVGGVFEGYVDAFVGVTEQRPFRVFLLQDPQRVVVDVAHRD